MSFFGLQNQKPITHFYEFIKKFVFSPKPLIFAGMKKMINNNWWWHTSS